MSEAALPDAWPLLLTRELAAAYLRISEASFANICPVAPVDLGVSLLRWRRLEIDAWIAALPARLRRAQAEAQGAPPPAPVTPADERREGAVARAAERSRCPRPKSRSSSASRAATAA